MKRLWFSLMQFRVKPFVRRHWHNKWLRVGNVYMRDGAAYVPVSIRTWHPAWWLIVARAIMRVVFPVRIHITFGSDE